MKRGPARHPIAQTAAGAARQQPDGQKDRKIAGGTVAMAQGLEQQQMKCAPCSLIRRLGGNLVQDKAGQRAWGEQIPIAAQPIERVAPIGFVAYSGACLFYVVNRQYLI